MSVADTYRDDPVLAAEFALGLLAGEDRVEATRLYVGDRAFAAEADAWTERFAIMNDEFEEVQPRKRVKRVLEERLWGDATGGVRRRGRLGWLVSGLMAAMLAAIAWTEISPYMTPRGELPAAVAELANADTGLRAVAFVKPDEHVLEFAVVEGTAPEGRVLELWAIQGDSAPQSLGLVGSGAQRVVLPEEITAANLQLAISEEPPGGSTTGAPTGEILAIAPVTGL